MKSRLVERMGMPYFKQMGEPEWEGVADKLFEKVDGVKTKDELTAYASKVHPVMDYGDGPLYKVYLIPDYQQDRSALVFKIHHAVSDGLGIASMFLAFSGEYKSNQFPAMKEQGIIKKGLLTLLAPVLNLYTVYFTLCVRPDNNSIRPQDQP